MRLEAELLAMDAAEFVGDGKAFAAYVKQRSFDHLDFGCSAGGSLLYARKTLGGHLGLGLDINPAKIDATRKAGFDAVAFDIHKIPAEPLVSFTVLSHFLEHVPSMVDAASFVKKACDVSKHFVFIQQPYFDADGYLARQGLKLYWSDWRGHPNRMTSLELWLIVRSIRASAPNMRVSIHARNLISNSDDPRIHPLDSPIDQHNYDPNSHPPKPKRIKFSEPVYSDLVCILSKDPVDHEDLVRRARITHTLLKADF